MWVLPAKSNVSCLLAIPHFHSYAVIIFLYLLAISQEKQANLSWFYMKHMLCKATSIVNDWKRPLCNESLNASVYSVS